MDCLTSFNLNDPELSLVPSLATEWKPSEGGKVWTFTLRQGVKWTDGVEFSAQHVIDGWERLLNAKTASEYAYQLFPLKNAKAYNAGKVTDFKQVGVAVNDKGQLVVTLEKPMGYFPMLLAHHSTAPLRKDIVEKFGDKWTDPDNIQTLGAYKLKVWDHDKAIVLERNEAYWGEKAKTKNILGYMINEFSTALNLYEGGKLDFQETIPYKELPRYRDNPGLHIVPSLSIYYYGFNVRKPPFNNPKIRHAFSMAVDRKQVTDLLAGGQTPLTGWVPRGMFGYEENVGLKFNPEQARKLLDEAGFKDRSKFPKITLAFNTNENHQRVAENVQAQIKKNLGIEVEVANEEWKVYLNRLKTDTPSIFRMGWLGDYPDPDNFMALMTSYSDNNKTGWANKKYDALVEEAASTLDKDKRRALYSEAQKILTETEAPVIPIFSDVRPILLSSRVQGFPLNSLNHWDLKGVSLK
jgi:oligopeptide transport system substrate-binding protein